MVSRLQRELEFSEMVNAEGRLLSKWLPTLKVRPAANIRLDAAREHLHWQERRPEMTYHTWLFYELDRERPSTADPTGMIDIFLRIKSPNDVLRFARRYGPLRLCGHGRPSSHRLEYSLIEAPPPDASCRPEGYPDDCSEPVSLWYSYVSQARALVEIGAALWQGRPGPKTAWKTALTSIGRYSSAPGLEEELGEWLGLDRQVLSALVLTDWLRAGNVHLAWYWKFDASQPSTWLAGGTFGLLAVQLVSALSHAGATLICDGCGELYPRQGRMPQAGRRNFCPACGEKGASKLRQRDQRARERKGESTARR